MLTTAVRSTTRWSKAFSTTRIRRKSGLETSNDPNTNPTKPKFNRFKKLYQEGKTSETKAPFNDIESAIEKYFNIFNDYKTENKRISMPIGNSKRLKISIDLLKTLSKSRDITHIPILKLLWENYMIQISTSELDLLYHAAFINIYLNSNQFEAAFQYTDNVIKHLLFLKKQVLDLLPIPRLLRTLSVLKHCDGVASWIKYIPTEERDKILDDNLWNLILNLGLSQNSYELVHFVYTNHIMKGLHNSAISTEDVILKINYTTDILSTLTDDIIIQILHTFATNGDVESTVSLIESLVLHKNAKGEKALSKDYCIKIIEAYCHNPDLKPEWEGEEYYHHKNKLDESFMGILGVINGFITKFKKDGNTLSYQDIIGGLSYRFWNYQTYDENVDFEINKRKTVLKKVSQLSINKFETKVLPQKSSNSNLATSELGNVFANMNTLENFTKTHFKFLSHDTKFHVETKTIFLNCVLQHLVKHQNTSGVIRVLLALQRADPDFLKIMDKDLFRLIFESMKHSMTTKRCSILLHQYLKQKGDPIPIEIYILVLQSNLRGYCHDAVHYIMYDYLLSSGLEYDRLLSTIPIHTIAEHSGTINLKNFLQNSDLNPDLINKFWIDNDLCKDYKSILFEKESDSKYHPGTEKHSTSRRGYYSDYDIQDAQHIEYLFPLKN